MHNKSIEEKINDMKLEKLKVDELEAEKQKIYEKNRKERNDKFKETFVIFFDYIKKCRNKKSEFLELLVHNRTSKKYKNETNQIMATINGVTINVIPCDIDIIQSNKEYEQILLDISFKPFNTSESIEIVTWLIENEELCSFTVKNNIPLDSEKFYIPQKVYFGYPINCKKVEVKTSISSCKYDKYHYFIKITYDETKNQYKLESIKDTFCYFNDKKFCCVDIYNSCKIDCIISKNELFANIETIENDLDNILISSNIDADNVLIKFENKKQKQVVFKPFDLNETYWNQSYNFINDMFIHDYPRYLANKLQQSSYIKELSKKWFEYTC